MRLFSEDTINYLINLSLNNDKQWFEEHKQEYQRYLLGPLQALVVELGDFMLSIDPEFEARPKIDKTISRIYRDTRFSKDKSPYKTVMWITFKKPIKQWQNEPAYFFEITADFYRFGMGCYCASKNKMDRFRENIDEKPEVFLKAISFISKQQTFEIAGKKYKRILDKTKSPEILEWYQRKNLYLVCNRSIDQTLFSKQLADDLIAGFELLAPFYHYLLGI